MSLPFVTFRAAIVFEETVETLTSDSTLWFPASAHRPRLGRNRPWVQRLWSATVTVG